MKGNVEVLQGEVEQYQESLTEITKEIEDRGENTNVREREEYLNQIMQFKKTTTNELNNKVKELLDTHKEITRLKTDLFKKHREHESEIRKIETEKDKCESLLKQEETKHTALKIMYDGNIQSRLHTIESNIENKTLVDEPDLLKHTLSLIFLNKDYIEIVNNKNFIEDNEKTQIIDKALNEKFLEILKKNDSTTTSIIQEELPEIYEKYTNDEQVKRKEEEDKLAKEKRLKDETDREESKALQERATYQLMKFLNVLSVNTDVENVMNEIVRLYGYQGNCDEACKNGMHIGKLNENIRGYFKEDKYNVTLIDIYNDVINDVKSLTIDSVLNFDSTEYKSLNNVPFTKELIHIVFSNKLIHDELKNILYLVSYPVNSIISILNKELVDLKDNTKKTLNQSYSCKNASDCVRKEISIDNKKYGFEEVHFPTKYESGEKNPKNFSNITSVSDSLYLQTILTPFTDDSKSDKTTILFNYGFSGTGKTTTNKVIIDYLLQQADVTLQEINVIYGVAGKEDEYKGLICGEYPYYKSGTITEFDEIIENKNLSTNYIDKAIEKFNKIEYTYDSIYNLDNIPGCKGTTFDSTRSLTKPKYIKATLNNDQSSRFHMSFKFIKNGKTLYVFDLAGSESAMDIVFNNSNPIEGVANFYFTNYLL